jgi:hypothetical protein
VARWAESPGAAREHDEALLGAVGTPDSSEPAARVAAVKIPLDHLLDYRPEEPILPLETTLILRQEPVEMMEKHPVENGPLRMSRVIDSGHGGRRASSPRKNGMRPGSEGQSNSAAESRNIKNNPQYLTIPE